MKSMVLFFWAVILWTNGFSQDFSCEEYPKVRIGMNLGFKFNNPGLQETGFNFMDSPEVESAVSDNYSFLNLFIANRIGKGWYIRSGLSFMPSKTDVDALYSIDNSPKERRLSGRLSQSILSFSWKVEYWFGKCAYINTGPAANMLLRNDFESLTEPGSSAFIEENWVGEHDFFWGWQSNIGGFYSFESFALQGNIGYLWGEQVDGLVGGNIPNLIHNTLSFSLGIISEL